MKKLHLIIPQHTLAENLNCVAKAIASKPTHPILANVRLDCDSKRQNLTLTGYDLNLGIKVIISAQVVTEGSITLPHKLFNDIVSKLPDEDITITMDDDGSNLVALKCGSGKYKMHGLPIEEYPELPTVEPDTLDARQLSPNVFAQGLSHTLFATSSDETKRILTGVHITQDLDAIEFAATDGHRLAVINIGGESNPDDDTEGSEGKKDGFEVTIPSKALAEVKKISESQECAIAFYCDKANAIFETSNLTLYCRLLDGTYPNYRQLIPNRFDRQITLERKLFLSALERIAVLADQKNNIVKLTVDTTGQELSLSVEAPDVAAGRESLPAQVSGEDIEIAFNIKYLLDGLKTIPSNEIQIQMNNATSPAVIVPIGATKMSYLLMPVQIRN